VPTKIEIFNHANLLRDTSVHRLEYNLRTSNLNDLCSSWFIENCSDIDSKYWIGASEKLSWSYGKRLT